MSGPAQTTQLPVLGESPADARERGGTFTFVTLALSALLLLSAGLLAGPSRSTLQGAASATRRSTLREGVFSGAFYAASTGSVQSSVLLLESCEVKVSPSRDEQGRLVVESSAQNGVGERLRLRARFDAAGALEHFEFLAPLKADQGPEAPSSPSPAPTPR